MLQNSIFRKLWDDARRITKSYFSPQSSLNQKNYSDSHLEKGIEYDNRFLDLKGRRLMWDLEKRILRKEVKMANDYLDFATGTGRIISALSDLANKKYGLDISEKMLEVAIRNSKDTQFINRDFREPIPELENKRFDLITAFRFFPGAENKLREDAMRFISNKLKKGGVLIVNNHRNFWSIPYVVMRIFFIKRGFGGMKNGEMIRLAKKYGLTLTRCYSMGIVTWTEKRNILPWPMVFFIENMLLRWARFHRLGYNVVFIFHNTL